MNKRRYFVFILTMPNVGSWNGKWTGEGNLYCRTSSYSKDSEYLNNILKEDYHYYDFGDGWTAGVKIKEITREERIKYDKKTKGFYDYEWMISEIEQLGRIRKLEERGKK